ncbi:MAG: hypothetical protein NC485_14225 [Ruminococcus flavefaciens]|nr:hypothetical protein [Ruminococcus flavefaciens]MCM1061508.1 hypothetical protein [Eubacterium sp.]
MYNERIELLQAEWQGEEKGKAKMVRGMQILGIDDQQIRTVIGIAESDVIKEEIESKFPSCAPLTLREMSEIRINTLKEECADLRNARNDGRKEVIKKIVSAMKHMGIAETSIREILSIAQKKINAYENKLKKEEDEQFGE